MSGENTPEKTGGLKPAWKPGQSGNPKGRPKGARNRLGEAFVKDLLSDWETHGKASIETMRAEKAADYVKVVASILPKELTGLDGDAIEVVTRIELVDGDGED